VTKHNMSCVVDIHPRLPNFKICQEPDDFFYYVLILSDDM